MNLGKLNFKLDSKRLRYVLLGALGLSIILFIAIAALGLGKLASKSQSMVDLKAQAAAADSQLNSLALAKKEIKQYGYFKTVAKEVIPNDKDQAAAVLQINQFASQSGFLLQAISFPASNLGLSSLSTGQVSAQTASPSSLLSQALPVVGVKGLYSVQLTITPQTDQDLPASQQVTYAKLLDFLNRIENNQRTAQISQIIIKPVYNGDGSFRTFDFTLGINIFIRP